MKLAKIFAIVRSHFQLCILESTHKTYASLIHVYQLQLNILLFNVSVLRVKIRRFILTDWTRVLGEMQLNYTWRIWHKLVVVLSPNILKCALVNWIKWACACVYVRVRALVYVVCVCVCIINKLGGGNRLHNIQIVFGQLYGLSNTRKNIF